MKTLKKALICVALAALAAAVVRASVVLYNTTFINESALAYSKNYVLDLTTVYTGSNLAGSMSYSTATLTSDTFTDGAQSTGSFTVGATTGLVCAAASDTLTINSNTILPADYVMVTLPNFQGGFQVTNNQDFVVGATTSNTATNIATALNAKLPSAVASASPSSNTVVITAQTCGARFNNATLASSTNSFVASSANWTGGVDNARVSVNGVTLKQGRDWNQNSSATTTATNIKNAINSSSALSGVVTATNLAGVITLHSSVVGVNAFPTTSNTANITVGSAAMTSGVAPSWALNGTNIHIPSHNLTTAYPVLYTVGGGPAIGGLTSGTTYYAVINGPSDIALADTSAHAVAGTNLRVLSSTSTQTSADTYTLAPLAFTGSASLQWQTSDDNSSWTNMTGISAVTINATGTASWSTLDITHRYIRAEVTGPTTGGAAIDLTLTGTQ